MKIRVLDKFLAAKIAAGEGIERPAAVVKELVENSLDAEACRITVGIEGAGLRLIRVADDGIGIQSSDLRTAFERHATSKITSEDDLENILTMGFRGEALPSIAGVANVEMASRLRGSAIGSVIKIQYGNIVEEGSVGISEGTIITVKDLFGNVPARKKFLRSDAAEVGRISTLVKQLALSYPSVGFNLTVDGRTRFVSSGNGVFRDVLARVYGGRVVESVMDVDGSDGDGRRIWGCVSSPWETRPNRGGINFYVNHRWIQSRLINQAIENTYSGMLMVGRYPIVAIHLEVSVDQLDVNVHPTKREVRFFQEGPIFSLVQRVVREALLSNSPVPLARSNFALQGHNLSTIASRITPVITSSHDGEIANQELITDAYSEERSLIRDKLPILRVLGQLAKTYIVAEGPTGMYLIDQHAAHERIVFELVCSQRLSVQGSMIQGLLSPLTLELSSSQIEIIDLWGEVLKSYGFDGEKFGGSTFLLRGVPSTIAKNMGIDRVFIEILQSLSQSGHENRPDDILAASIACHGAVRAGDSMSQEEMSALLRQLEDLKNPHTCPHGRPTMIELTKRDLDRDFGRR